MMTIMMMMMIIIMLMMMHVHDDDDDDDNADDTNNHPDDIKIRDYYSGKIFGEMTLTLCFVLCFHSLVLVTGRTDFMFIKDRYIDNFNNAILNGITLESCATACVSASSFICRSFDYNPPTSTCYLSEENDLTVYLHVEYNPAFHLFVRISKFSIPCQSSGLLL